MQIRTISSLEKCFRDEAIESKPELVRDTMLMGERYSFQVAYVVENPDMYTVTVDSSIKDAISVRVVEHIPVRFPAYAADLKDDTDYLRTTPGLYPDLLRPYEERNCVKFLADELNSLWITVEPGTRYPAGIYPITLTFKRYADGTVEGSVTFTIEILNAELPKQTILYTDWFHTDCLSVYYHAPVFSEKYWEIVENFMKNAAKNGINLILTPTFTPPLDTQIGWERPTVQLVDVTLENGEYTFEFSKVGRWVNLAKKCGIENFEIAHLFTQWGAKAAPKVMATVVNADGTKEYKRIFGWETQATSDEYRTFIRAFLSEFLAYMKKNGWDKNCYFHISDEPSAEQLPYYLAAKDMIRDLLEGYTIMDALSHYEFYESGALETPIPSTGSVQTFIDHNVPNLWTYYCCGAKYRSNRFFAMPSARNRIIGTQMYKYNVVGFLHWGYNFYFCQYSLYPIDPYTTSDGDLFAPSGDCYSVYPAPDYTAYDSIRMCVFYDGLQDMRLMKLAEELCGREAVLDVIDGDRPDDAKLTFLHCPGTPEYEYPWSSDYLLSLRAKLHAMIKEKKGI